MKTVLSLIETAGPGGAETVCVEVLRGLDRTRWRGIAIIPHDGWLRDRLADSGIETHVIRERRSLDLAFFRRALSIARSQRVDVVHGHLFGSSVRAAALSRVAGARSVGTLHGMSDISPRESLMGLKVGLLRRALDRLVLVSEPLRESFLQQVAFPADRARVIPNGIDVARFRDARGDAFRESLGIRRTDFVVGSVGNLNLAKGYDVLLRAAAILKQQGHDARFVVIGDNNGRQSAELAALRDQLGLTNEFLFAGFRSDVPSALAAFDVFAVTSRSEGFSIALIEAMAAGLPVVSTRCGGPEQIIADGITGLLVANESPDAVAAAIVRLRDDTTLRRSLAAAAQESVAARFTLAAQVRAYEAVYEEALAPRRASDRRSSTHPGVPLEARGIDELR